MPATQATLSPTRRFIRSLIPLTVFIPISLSIKWIALLQVRPPIIVIQNKLLAQLIGYYPLYQSYADALGSLRLLEWGMWILSLGLVLIELGIVGAERLTPRLHGMATAVLAFVSIFGFDSLKAARLKHLAGQHPTMIQTGLPFIRSALYATGIGLTMYLVAYLVLWVDRQLSSGFKQ